jgi:hypothetical protein
LPNSSSLKLFPNNTVTRFVTKLAKPLEFQGLWEVALVEITYPYTWANVHTGENILWVGKNGGEMFQVIVPPGRYVSPKHLIQTVAELVYKESRQNIWIDFSTEAQKCNISIKDGAIIHLNGRLARQLGFTKDIAITTNVSSPNPINPEAGFETLYVYSDIAEMQLVGDVQAPLLRTVNVTETKALTVCKSFSNPHYLPVTRSHLDTIEIDIRDDAGKKVPFESGKSIVKLHFRQRKSPYFQ